MASNFADIEFNISEKKEFFNSLSALYESGLPLGDIFKSMITSTRNEKIKRICSYVSKQIDKGKTLDQALAACSGAIGIAYTALIAAGEEAGKLENILSNICSNIAKQQEIKSNLITALIYPVCIFCFSLAVAMLFQFFVIPMFKSVTDYDMVVNPVKMLIVAIIKIIFVFAVIFGTIFYLNRDVAIRKTIQRFLSSLPIIRGILKNYYLSTFFYTFSLAYDAGIPAANALKLSNSVIGMEHISNKIAKAHKSVVNGAKISVALNEANVFSGFAMSQIAAGEESGQLEKTLRIAARDYESQMDLAIKAMMKILGPVVLIIVGIIVGCIIIKGYSEYYKSILSMF